MPPRTAVQIVAFADEVRLLLLRSIAQFREIFSSSAEAGANHPSRWVGSPPPSPSNHASRCTPGQTIFVHFFRSLGGSTVNEDGVSRLELWARIAQLVGSTSVKSPETGALEWAISKAFDDRNSFHLGWCRRWDRFHVPRLHER